MKFVFSNTIKALYRHVSQFCREMPLVAIVIVVFVLSVLVSKVSYFSFIKSFATATVSAEETVISNSVYNAQTEPLLGTDTNGCSSNINNVISIDNDSIQSSVGLSGSLADVDACPSATAISTYVVQNGDTLSQIAKMFDVSINTIVWANDLGTKPTIKPGQILAILPISGINYTVKKGDTLASIVKKYGGDQTEVLEFNGLSSASELAVGTAIIIPDGEIGVTQSVSTPIRTSHGIIYEPYLGGGGPVAPGPYAGGYYECPVHGARLSQGLHGHNAVDLAIGIGNPIYAAADGTVIIAKNNGGWNGGYGNYVVIAHPNGTETLYAHAEKVLVSIGQQVSAGDIIGKIGITGETTGPHIHFEIRGAKNPFVNVKC
ncbi:MAG: M23 family metallopeptidase [Patescibacteria group bacterium]|nr:M23 family metallopeptidase [Patescibacteria group bacterium]